MFTMNSLVGLPYLFRGGRFDGLFDEVNEIGRAKLAQSLQAFCSDFDYRVGIVFVEPGL